MHIFGSKSRMIYHAYTKNEALILVGL